MRINKISLENFLGIYAGMNRTKVEIDFKNNKNRIIILNAANGKGKTTLLSMLHPLRETYDLRKDIVIPNELGHKIVDLVHNGDEYHIEHFYGKKNKSFISKNGVELNENGNIKSFNELAKIELGIDDEYFKIGRIGSNVSNFIDLKSTDRKKYITEFIPSIDEYLEAYDIIKDKYTDCNSQLKLIKGNIEKYSGTKTLDEIKGEITLFTKQQNNYQSKLAKVNVQLESFNDDKEELENNIVDFINKETEYEMDDFEEDINDLTLTIDDDIDELEEARNECQEIYDEFITNNKVRVTENVLEYIQKLEAKFEARYNSDTEHLDELEKKSDDLMKQYNAALNRVEDYENKLKDLNLGITAEQAEVYTKDIQTAEKEKTLAKNKLKMLKKSVDEELVEAVYNHCTDNKLNPMALVDTAKDIIDSFDNIKSNYEINTLKDYYEYLNSNDSNIKEDSVSIKKQLSDLDNKISKLNKDINIIEGKLEIANDSLSKRSVNCNDDECGFIKNSIETQKKGQPEIKRLRKELSTCTDEYNSLEAMRVNLEMYTDIYNSTQSIFKTVKKAFPSQIASKFIEREMLITNNTTLIEDLKIDCIEKIFVLEENISEYEDHISEMNTLLNTFNVSKSLVEEYTTQLNEASEMVDKFTEESDKITDGIKDLKLKINDDEQRINLCKDFYEINGNLTEATNKYNKALEVQETIATMLQKYKKFLTEHNVAKLTNDKDLFENSLKEIKSKLEDSQTAVRIITDNMDKLQKIEEDFNDIVLIKDALDPKKGIPMVFANEYLKSISTKANKLLNIAYGDQFKIRFNITSSDFFVEVYKGDGSFLTDIKLASQGETSLTNVSLSLAMLEAMIKNYNILYLDEIDSVLSTDNRRCFIDMLEAQLDNLNIEQCFIISHNNEFYDKDVDLILLEGYDCNINDPDFMKGKNIIYKYA